MFVIRCSGVAEGFTLASGALVSLAWGQLIFSLCCSFPLPLPGGRSPMMNRVCLTVWRGGEMIERHISRRRVALRDVRLCVMNVAKQRMAVVTARVIPDERGAVGRMLFRAVYHRGRVILSHGAGAFTRAHPAPRSSAPKVRRRPRSVVEAIAAAAVCGCTATRRCDHHFFNRSGKDIQERLRLAGMVQ